MYLPTTKPCIDEFVLGNVKMCLQFVLFLNTGTMHTENKRSSIWQLCRHWWHSKLSVRPLTVTPVTTKLPNWQIFVFSAGTELESFWKTRIPLFCTTISCLLMVWRRKEPRHQLPWYWHRKYLGFSTTRLKYIHYQHWELNWRKLLFFRIMGLAWCPAKYPLMSLLWAQLLQLLEHILASGNVTLAVLGLVC